jgi:very-short-patch-repair endonuclease
LIVELDGGQHADRPEDGRRGSELCARVIRFWNNDVIDNLDGVLEALEAELEKWPLTPPSPRKRGEGDGQAGGRLF